MASGHRDWRREGDFGSSDGGEVDLAMGRVHRLSMGQAPVA